MRPLLLLCALLLAAPATADAQPLSVRDAFRVGSGGNILCSAQSLTTDPALADMFDRAYSIVCRDAALPVGRLYVLRERGVDPAARLAAIREERISCQAGEPADIEGLGRVETLSCRLKAADIGYRVYLRRAGNAL